MSESFGQYLKRHMKEQKVTQQELADKIGVARSTVSLYVLDTTFPSSEVLGKIQTTLNLDSVEVAAITAAQKAELKDSANETIKAAYGKEAIELLECYSHLTKQGKEKLMERVSELLEIKRYNTKWLLDKLTD